MSSKSEKRGKGGKFRKNNKKSKGITQEDIDYLVARLLSSTMNVIYYELLHYLILLIITRAFSKQFMGIIFINIEFILLQN